MTLSADTSDTTQALGKSPGMTDAPQSTNLTPFPPITAYVFDGKGGGKQVDETDIDKRPPKGGFTWVHVQRSDPKALKWLDASDLDAYVVAALTAEETRPRCTVDGDGALINLRGVNVNPGAEPEDMISIRLWVEGDRIISAWQRPLIAVRDIADSCDRNAGPVSTGDFIGKLALRLADRAEPTVSMLNEKIDDLEEAVLEGLTMVERHTLADVRRMAIVLRRYMFPQRDALTTLEIEDLTWLGEPERAKVREAAERVTRLGEELDAIRDRAQIVHDQIMDSRAEMMNRQMLVLTVVAAIFLPLGLLTGLLGVNVGGIPGADNPLAFWIVCLILLLVGAAEAWYFMRTMLRR